MASERDYPFDPALRPEEQQGLNKLRCVEDRGMAATLYQLWFQVRDPMPRHEEYDPSTYGDQEPEPDLSDLHSPAGARADEDDRNNACIYHAWREFYARLDAYEQLHGRRLSQQQRSAHMYKFGGIMLEAYGRAHPSPTWEAKHKDWAERSGAPSRFKGAAE